MLVYPCPHNHVNVYIIICLLDDGQSDCSEIHFKVILIYISLMMFLLACLYHNLKSGMVTFPILSFFVWDCLAILSVLCFHTIFFIVSFIFLDYYIITSFPVSFPPSKSCYTPIHALFQIHGPFFIYVVAGICVYVYRYIFLNTTCSVLYNVIHYTMLCIMLLVYILSGLDIWHWIMNWCTLP